MEFSNTTSKLGIIQACESYLKLGDAGISGNALLLKEMTRLINHTNRKVWHWIFTAYGGWQYDSSEQTDLPAASDAVVASQTSYALPTSALTVRGVEVKNTSGIWNTLEPVTEEQIRTSGSMGEFNKTAGNPVYYQLVGDSIRLYPPTNYSQASSIKVFFDRGSVAFASTDTTATPGFASEYHDIIPIGASLEKLKMDEPDSSTTKILMADYADYERRIKDFYQIRWLNKFPPRITVRDALREYT